MYRRVIISLAVMLAVSFLMSVSVHAGPNMQEGTWEIKGEMKLEGMPFPMPAVPISYTQCLTKKDMVPQQKEKNTECSMESTKVDGNTVTWAAKCKDKKGAVTESTGAVTYKGASFDGKIHTVTTDTKGAKSESNLTMSGKRTGDCK